jgi:hypothetical protein
MGEAIIFIINSNFAFRDGNPSATADGTDCFQVRLGLLRQSRDALTVPPELVRITVAIDPACSLITGKRKAALFDSGELFAPLEQVSSVLLVESSDTVA